MGQECFHTVGVSESMCWAQEEDGGGGGGGVVQLNIYGLHQEAELTKREIPPLLATLHSHHKTIVTRRDKCRGCPCSSVLMGGHTVDSHL